MNGISRRMTRAIAARLSSAAGSAMAAHLTRYPIAALVAAGGTEELDSLTPDEHA